MVENWHQVKWETPTGYYTMAGDLPKSVRWNRWNAFEISRKRFHNKNSYSLSAASKHVGSTLATNNKKSQNIQHLHNIEMVVRLLLCFVSAIEGRRARIHFAAVMASGKASCVTLTHSVDAPCCRNPFTYTYFRMYIMWVNEEMCKTIWIIRMESKCWTI